jgi:hypothetical protein
LQLTVDGGTNANAIFATPTPIEGGPLVGTPEDNTVMSVDLSRNELNTDRTDLPNWSDLDDDNDGLTDFDEEHIHGTDRLNADTDRDGQRDDTDPCPLDPDNVC